MTSGNSTAPLASPVSTLKVMVGAMKMGSTITEIGGVLKDSVPKTPIFVKENAESPALAA